MTVLKCLGGSSRAPNKLRLIFRTADSKIPLPMKCRHGHRITTGKEGAFTESFPCADADSRPCKCLEESTQDTGEVVKKELSPETHDSINHYSFIHSKSFWHRTGQDSNLSSTTYQLCDLGLSSLCTSVSHLKNGNTNSAYILQWL